MPQTPEQTTSAGWTVGQSIATELDVALAIVGGSFNIIAGSDEFQALNEHVPADWLAESRTVLGDPAAEYTLGFLAGLVDMKAEADYGRATLAMRELTADDALEKLAGQAADLRVTPDLALPPAEALADLAIRVTLALHAGLGYDTGAQGTGVERRRQEVLRITRVLRDGELHSHFWHWLDRFFYEVYQPWRRTREHAIKTLESHALAMLGSLVGDEAPPLAWLPAQNPLRVFQSLQDGVTDGRLRVFFWIEPFGLIDLWDLDPGQVLVSFSTPGAIYHNFHAFADDVAVRTKALADPTRLIILRLIRHFGMMNTELANFMEISRPTVSVHAKILREAGLIRSEQHGREVRHEIVPSEVRRLFSDLERFLDLPEE